MKAIQVIKEEGFKGFFARWKAGINQITPLQQIQAQLVFTRITLLGISLGFAVSIYFWHTAWWLSIILAGAFGNTYLGLVGLNQRKAIMLELENSLKGGL